MYQNGWAVACLAAVLALAGCGPEQATGDRPETVSVSLPGTHWQIESIDEAGIVDRSMITLQFALDGGAAGSAGCNRYFGDVSLQGDQLSFAHLGSTGRACVPALMSQEQRFLAALQAVSSYLVDERQILLLLDSTGAPRLRAVRIAAAPTATSVGGNEPQDRASDTRHRFDCDSAGTIEVRFVGPETLELMRNGVPAILQRLRSGSGARYAGDGIEFWNKGDEAMLSVGGVGERCIRAE